MFDQISRRRFLSGMAASVAASLASPLHAEAPLTSLRPKPRNDDLFRRSQPDPAEIIARAGLGGSVAFCVADLRTGSVLEQQDSAVALPPASVAKALTAAYALEALGPGHHFETRLIATGGVLRGEIQGDLILAGGGDPTLDTDALAGLATELKAAGITGVKGAFKVWGGGHTVSVEIDPDQPDHVGYNPAVSGLNLNYNRVHFEWRRAANGYDVTMDARSAAHRPAVRMARMSVAARDLPVYTYSDADGHDVWTVARGALGDGGARWLPVRKPELYAGEVFQVFARSQGIVLKAPEIAGSLPEGRVMATHHSPALRLVLRDMMRWSTNLTAEVIGIAATTRRSGKPPLTIRESAEAMNLWARERLGLKSMAFVDHSGLGDGSRISAGDMMSGLLQLRRRTGIKALMRTFPLRDEKRRVIENHPLSVHAKTGTLNFVSGLSGFVDLPDGRELVFAIFAANLAKRDVLTVEQRESPPGGADWNRRAKTLQQALIERWGVVHAG